MKRPGKADLLTLLSLAAFAVSIAATIHHREWNSDDVGMQQLLTTFRPFQEEIGHVTDDTFVLKFPLYTLVHAAIGASVRALIGTIWIIQATSIGLLIWAVRRVARQSPNWKSLMP
jgi:hypothetical protein